MYTPKPYIIGLLIIISLTSCHSDNQYPIEKAKAEITKAEKDFETMVIQKGLAEAFAFFADENAVIRRNNDSIIHGREGIRNFYSSPFFKRSSATWSPDFIDISKDGTMAYTYGRYAWQSKDSTGHLNVSTGVFHTVWKRQKDGGWKYVWD